MNHRVIMSSRFTATAFRARLWQSTRPLGLLCLAAVACDTPIRAEPRPGPPSAGSAPVRSHPVPSSSSLAAPRHAKDQVLTWDFEDGPFGRTRAVVLVPAHASQEHRLPVLVAFHGRGEALKGMRRGARGWVDDYELDVAIARLRGGQLSRGDFHGFVTEQRLDALQRRLRTHPYRGLIVVCPYLPDVLKGDRAFREGEALADFVADRLLARVYAQTPALERAAVDGVSLGGRAALLVGLLRPRAFRSVGALQPAVDDGERRRWTAMARDAKRANPDLRLRLLTSDEDYFLSATKSLGAAWRSAGIDVTVDVVTGPHDYVFNRGPGAYEMLLHHASVLSEP